jgi:hypothetical protein
MKIKLIFIALTCLLFVSCYSAGSLPDKVENEYEFAFPLFDTVFNVKDFPYFNTISHQNDALLPSGDTITSRRINFPVYLKEWKDKGQIIEWIEPKLILNFNDMPDGITLLNVYVGGSNAEYPFWLPENYETQIAANTSKTIQEPCPQHELENLKSHNNVYFDVSFSFKNDVRSKDLQTSYIRARMGIKIKVKMTFKIDV